MTSTTEISATRPLPGNQYPEAARTVVETYWWHLAALREAAARDDAAAHVQALASAAGQVAAALTGTAEAAPDTARDPLAWTDIATYLTCLAAALRHGQVNFGDRMGFSDLGQYGWDDLASAATRREFAAAWYPIREDLVELAALPDGDRGPRLRAFTAAQVIRAAAALIDAPW